MASKFLAQCGRFFTPRYLLRREEVVKAGQVDEGSDCLSQLCLATSKSRTDRFLMGQIRLNLKSIFVDFGVNDLKRDFKNE